MRRRRTKVYRTLGKVLFAVYVLFLLYFLIFSDWYGRTSTVEGYRYNLELFKEIRRFIFNRQELGTFTVFANVFGNILIFIPFGFFISMASRTKGWFRPVWYSFILSLCVEIFQLFTRIGSFDVDDLLLNTLGGLAGYLLYLICRAVRRRRHARG